MSVTNLPSGWFASRAKFDAAQAEHARVAGSGSRPRRWLGRVILLTAALGAGLVATAIFIRGGHAPAVMATQQDPRMIAGNEAFVSLADQAPDGLRARGTEQVRDSHNDQPALAQTTASGTALRVMKAGAEITSVAFSPDGKKALTGDTAQVFRVWDLETGKEKESSRKTFRMLEKITFAPDGSRFAGTTMQNVDVYEVGSGKAMLSLNSGSPHTGPRAFARTGRRVILGKTAVFGDPYVLVWDLESGKTFRWKGHKKASRVVGLSADGKQALSAGDDGLCIWEVESGKVLCRLDRPAVVSAVFSPDGKQVLTGEVLGSLTLWDVATGQEARQFQGHTRAVTCLTHSADGTRMVSGSLDGTIRVWDLPTGQEVQRLEGHEDGVTCIALAGDGRRILSGGTDGTMRVWQIGHGKGGEKP